MKLKTTILLILLTSFGLSAQTVDDIDTKTKKKYIEKGDIITSLNLLYSSKKTKVTYQGISNSEEEPSYTIRPEGHFMLTDKIGAGAKLEFKNFGTNEEFNGETIRMTEISNAYYLSLRYMLYSGRFYANTDLDLGLIKSNRESKNTASNLNSTGSRVKLGLSCGYFITSKLSITATLNNLIEYNDYTVNYNEGYSVQKTRTNIAIGDIASLFVLDSFGVSYKF